MEKYNIFATPGEPHKFLAKFAGSWNAAIKIWSEPDKPAQEAVGACERNMILGGRYLHEEFVGEMNGSPFTGIGFTGYNNQTKRFISTWMDTMGTNILFFEGKEGGDGQSIVLESQAQDPVRGTMKWRETARIVDDNTNIFELSGADSSGKQYQMHITYTRKSAEKGITITRIFDAPRELLYSEWTDPGLLERWWGPKGFTLPVYRSELKKGGVVNYCMRSPEGMDFCGRAQYLEIDPPRKIVYRDSFADKNGNPVSASYYGLSPQWPAETIVTITFEDAGGRTRVTLNHAFSEAPAKEREMCFQGWSQSLDKLSAELKRSCAELGVC